MFVITFVFILKESVNWVLILYLDKTLTHVL